MFNFRNPFTTVYTQRKFTSRKMTEAERLHFDRAFAKMAEAFGEMDKAFDEAGRR